jgi:hypothetical protein
MTNANLLPERTNTNHDPLHTAIKARLEELLQIAEQVRNEERTRLRDARLREFGHELEKAFNDADDEVSSCPHERAIRRTRGRNSLNPSCPFYDKEAALAYAQFLHALRETDMFRRREDWSDLSRNDLDFNFGRERTRGYGR